MPFGLGPLGYFIFPYWLYWLYWFYWPYYWFWWRYWWLPWTVTPYLGVPRETEAAILEDQRRAMERMLKDIEERLRELKGEEGGE